MTEKSAITELATHYFESKAHTELQVIIFKFTWAIKNFSFCSVGGKQIMSPSFPDKADNEMRWRLSLSRWEDFKHDNCVSINVELRNSPKNENVQASFKVNILDKCLKPVLTEQSNILTFRPRIIDEDHRLVHRVSRWSIFGQENGILQDDTLTLFCKITVPSHVFHRYVKVKIPKPTCTLHTDISVLLEKKNLSDLTICATDGKEIKAHKVILSARSAVFEAMFSHETEENRNNLVKITDIDYEVLKEMLCYIYTGEAPNLKEMATELLFAADKYALEPLKCMCLKVMFENLSIDNVAEVFQAAHIHGAELLKGQAKDFLVARASNVIKTDGWKSMVRTHPDLGMEALSALAILKT